MKLIKSGKRQNRLAAPIGGAFVVLALIGLVTVIVLAAQATSKIVDNSQEKQKFAQVITPVLMFDPVPFNKAEELDPLFILRSSIWATLMEKKSSYTYDDMNRITVPSSDVDITCARLFGADIKLKHQSFQTFTTAIYSYNEDVKAYYVPIEAENILYIPKVLNIEQKDDIFTLTVAYLPPGNSWVMSQNTETGEPKPDKYMIYVLEKTDRDVYRLVSIKDPPDGAVPELKAPEGEIPPQQAVPPPAQENAPLQEPKEKSAEEQPAQPDNA
ncbi:MAG: hypothetical protein RR205_01650 [Oscillospiraceae bacterium]